MQTCLNTSTLTTELVPNSGLIKQRRKNDRRSFMLV